MDFDDDSSAPLAKPASKFQPKAKARPRPKKDSSSSSTVKSAVAPHVPAKSSNPESVLASQSTVTKLDDASQSHPAVVDAVTPIETSSFSDALDSQNPLFSSQPLLATQESRCGHTGSVSSEVVAREGPGLGFDHGKSKAVLCSKESGPDGDNLRQSNSTADTNHDILDSAQDMQGLSSCILDTRGESYQEATIFSNTEVIHSDQGGVGKEVQEDSNMGDGLDTMTGPYTDCLLNQEDLLEPPFGLSPDLPNSIDPTTNFSLDQEENLQESNRLNFVASEMIYSTDIPGMSEELDRSGNAPDSNFAENLNDDPFATYASNVDGSETFHDQQMVASQFDCVPNSTANGNEGSSAEDPNKLITDGQDNQDDSNNGKGKASRKRRSSKRSNKDSTGETATGCSRKKKAKVVEESNEEHPPMKFSHSTRRKRSTFDPTLLDKDDVELDKVPIRDLIKWGDYNDRQKPKQPVATAETAPERSPTPTPLKNVSQEYDDNWGEDEGFGDLDAFNQEGTTFDDPSSSAMQRSTNIYNYHTYMKRTPKVKWSKQDTELFYEGLRQFGTDFSMIELLFPGRSRRQIKLKYKKEERQYPMKLHEASTTRAKDLSHFQRVIGILQERVDREESQQEAAEEEDLDVGADNDENPEDTDAEIHVKTAKSEEIRQEDIAADRDKKMELKEPKSPDRSVVYEEDEDDDDDNPYMSLL